MLVRLILMLFKNDYDELLKLHGRPFRYVFVLVIFLIRLSEKGLIIIFYDDFLYGFSRWGLVNQNSFMNTLVYTLSFLVKYECFCFIFICSIEYYMDSLVFIDVKIKHILQISVAD